MTTDDPLLSFAAVPLCSSLEDETLIRTFRKSGTTRHGCRSLIRGAVGA